MNGGGQGG